MRRFRYSDFGVATEVATVTLLDEHDREENAKFGSWLSTRRVEPPWRINTARESSWTANDLTPPEDGTPTDPRGGWSWCSAWPALQPASNRLMLHQSHCRPVSSPKAQKTHRGLAKGLCVAPAQESGHHTRGADSLERVDIQIWFPDYTRNPIRFAEIHRFKPRT